MRIYVEELLRAISYGLVCKYNEQQLGKKVLNHIRLVSYTMADYYYLK